MTKKPTGPENRACAGDSFPRGAEIPDCTPTFFAQNKERFLRQLLIKDIEERTKRRLLVSFSNPDRRPGFRARDHEGFRELLSDISNGDPFDLLIESPGGETDVAESIVTMLQRFGGRFRAIVPGQAKSNATLLALAANEIVMLPSSEIGPIDPIIGGKPANVLFDNRLRDSADLNDRILYTTAADAIEHTKQIATELLTEGMMTGLDSSEISETVNKLCQSEKDSEQDETKRIFYSHSASICSKQAKLLKLNVNDLEHGDPLERQLVYLHAIYTQDCRNLGYDKIYETSRVSNILFFNNQ